jgi:hypothetical protein
LRTVATVLALVLLLIGSAAAQTYEVPWYTVDSGGIVDASGNLYTAGGTIGQADAGDMTGGLYAVKGGYWVLMTEAAPAALRPMPEDCGEVCSLASCTTDDDCAEQSHCVAAPTGDPPGGMCYAPKHRYLSIVRHADQVANTARRVRLQGGAVLGWVGAPDQNAGLWLAEVVALPVYEDIDFTGTWPTTVHVSDCEVATGETYEIQAIALGQDIGNEANYSEPLVLHTPTKWGDVVAQCPGDVCTPPQGIANLDDIMAKIKKFQAIPVAPLMWLDDDPSAGSESPNQVINLGDIMNSVRGFQGEPYPGDGPLGCP